MSKRNPRKVDCPPAEMKTWIVRLCLGQELKVTSACVTEHDALKCARDWRANGQGYLAYIDVITQPRKLRA